MHGEGSWEGGVKAEGEAGDVGGGAKAGDVGCGAKAGGQSGPWPGLALGDLGHRHCPVVAQLYQSECPSIRVIVIRVIVIKLGVE